jgi:hypothetical protein
MALELGLHCRSVMKDWGPQSLGLIVSLSLESAARRLPVPPPSCWPHPCITLQFRLPPSASHPLTSPPRPRNGCVESLYLHCFLFCPSIPPLSVSSPLSPRSSTWFCDIVAVNVWTVVGLHHMKPAGEATGPGRRAIPRTSGKCLECFEC